MRKLNFLFFCILIFNFSFSQKMNGISIWGEKHEPNLQDFGSVNSIGANWVSIQPYAFVKSDNSGVDYNRKNYWYSQSMEGVKKYIKYAHKNNLKVLIKPHLKVEFGGFWSGNIQFDSEDKWRKFEYSYFDYIQELAKISEEMNVEAFSLGVELKSFVNERKITWNHIIDSIRKLYHGKLTYCSNWDEYQGVTFWGKLDFIGIDAYFSVSSSKTPTVSDCIKGWHNEKIKLQKLHLKYNKQIVFTEFGYPSTNNSAHNPWKWGDDNKKKINLEGQANAYKAVFKLFWKEQWFGGGFSWVWYLDYSKSGGNKDKTYTPQNKPAEKVIKKYYFMYNKI